MSDFEVQITGLKEVEKSLYSYSQQLGDKVVIASLMNGARLIQRQAKKNAPRLTGALSKNIIVRKSKYQKSDKRAVYVRTKRGKGTKSGKAYYGHAIEYGWRVRGTGAKQLAREFLGRAVASQSRTATDLIISSLIAGSDVVARKTGLK